MFIRGGGGFLDGWLDDVGRKNGTTTTPTKCLLYLNSLFLLKSKIEEINGDRLIRIHNRLD